MKKVLLVENNAFLINVYTRQLRKSGYSTTVAANSEIAAIKVKNINPDLLVLDADVPEGDTFSVLRKFREDAGMRELKIIVLSSAIRAGQDDNVLALPDVACISKVESTAEEIVEEITKILS